MATSFILSCLVIMIVQFSEVSSFLKVPTQINLSSNFPLNDLSGNLVDIDSNTPKKSLINQSSKSRSEINEMILQLEKSNPTVNPAYSPRLNGVWELTVSGITSPGLLIFQALKLIPGGFIEASNITLTISSLSPRVKAETFLKVGSFKTEVTITTDLVAESGLRLREEYVSGSVAGVDIPLSSISILNRELLVTYLDEDLLIVRDFLGSPEILKRTGEAVLTPSTALGVPSASDEEGAPGS